MIYIVVGMIIFWAATFLFVWSVARRQRQLEDEVTVLREVVGEKPSDPA